MKKGDHLVTPRTGYTHHGIYIGGNDVIHYAGFSDGMKKDRIAITSLEEFKNGHSVTVNNYLSRTYDYEEAVERAYSRLDEDWYNVLVNNCEHFANWCVMGVHSSSQVNSLIAAAALTRGLIAPATNPTIVNALAGLSSRSLVSSTISSTTASLAGSGVSSAFVSSTVGATAGIATSSLAGVATVGVAGLASAPLLPIIAVGAAGAAAGYGLKKAWDWFTD
jgi:hypothetical protein